MRLELAVALGWPPSEIARLTDEELVTVIDVLDVARRG